MTQTSNLREKIKYVENKFAKTNIKVDNDWLSGCIEFFCSEDPRISNEGLYENAREQWLLADLTEVGQGCLPETVRNKKEEFTLDKMYPLQLQWLLDISESCYDQWRNVYDKKLDEVEEVSEFNTTAQNKNNTSNKKRVLKLELTDGKITTHAIEYKPVTCLNTKLTPGCKILLNGPIRCINKILFLEPKNVQILGGEVDTLLIENAYENILLKHLGKPINPIPKTDYNELPVVEIRNPPRTVPLAERTPFDSKKNKYESDDPLPPPRPKVDQHIAMEDDDFLLDINLDEIEKKAVFMDPPTTTANKSAQIKPTTIQQKPTTIRMEIEEDDQFLDDLDILNDIENEIKNDRANFINPVARNTGAVKKLPSPPKRDHPSEPDSPKPPPKRTNTFDDFVDHSNFFDSTMDFDVNEIDANVAAPPKRITTILDDDYEYKVAGVNLATTDEILKYRRDELDTKSFMVYCEIDSVAEKLQIKNNEYCLGVYLKDYTERQIQARFDTDVLSKLAEYTPQELQLMRQTEKEKPHFKNQINQILTKLKTNLQELKCFMKIAYIKKGKTDFPIIIELITTNNTDINTLNRKKKG